MIFLIYPFVSASVLGTFVCDEVAGIWYLNADFTVHCFDDRWNHYAAFAAVMIAVFPLVMIHCLLSLVLSAFY